MKKILLFGFFICIIASLHAQSVDEQTAQIVAENFYNAQNQHKNNASLSLYCTKAAVNTQKSGEKGTYYYIFNDESNGGFVLVSGDKRVEPILGYSTEGKFDTTNMPDNLRYWLKGYEDEIDYAIANFNEAPQESAEKWNNYINNIQPKNRKAVVVAPLIQTQWGQDAPYNEYCPYDNTVGERTLTGCVATAMAQIMKYWEYPIVGNGGHSYRHSKYGTISASFETPPNEWSLMPNILTSSSSSSAKFYVAMLMYYCGVAVEMDYSPSGSGSTPYMAALAFQNYFGYEVPIATSRTSSITTSQWISILKTCLDAGVPIYYDGTNSQVTSGHAFICDGYNDNNQFHFNWGWNGQCQNAYYTISALTPASGHNYSYNNTIIVVVPPMSVDMRLFTAITINQNKDTILQNTALSVSAGIVNYGFKNFNGNIGFDVYNSANVFMGTIGTQAQQMTPSSWATTITIQNSGLTYPNGRYYIVATYKEQDSAKKIIGGVSDRKYFNIISLPKADLQLFNTISVSPTTIYPDSSISVTANIVNQGDKAFTGKIGLDLYNNSGVFLQTLVEANHTLAPSASQTISVNQSALSYPVGTYYIVTTYTEQDSAKKIIGGVSDRKYFNIISLPKADLQLSNTISVSPTTIYPDSSISVTANIVNQGDKAFTGKIGLDLYNNSGVFLQTLVEANHTLAPSASQTIRVNQLALSYPVGTYYIVATYTEQDSAKKIIGNTSDRKYFDIVPLPIPKAILSLQNTIILMPTTIYPDSSISVTANIVNQGDKAFTGKIGLDLYNNSSVFLQTLVEANHTLAPFAFQTIRVNQLALSYPVGTYYIVATYTEQDSVKKIIGNTSDRKYFDIVNLTMVDMALYSAITINPEQVCQNTPLVVSVTITNNGNKDFDGKLGIDLYSNDGVYMETLVEEQQFVAKKQGFSSLATINANHQGFAYPAGRYYLVATYTEKNSSKKVIGTTSDRKYFNIETKAVNIQLFSDININPNEVYKNTAFAVSASIINSGSKDFNGYISFDIYNASDDTYVGELGKVEETVPHATYKTITINRNDINYAVGRYFIISSYMEKDSLKWKPVLSDKYNTKAYFEIKTGVNIEEHQTWQAVLYPNPSIDKFILKTSEILDNTIAEIFDMTGKSLYKTTINSQETILDLTSFRQGVYLLKVTNKDNLHMYKLIKQ